MTGLLWKYQVKILLELTIPRILNAGVCVCLLNVLSSGMHELSGLGWQQNLTYHFENFFKDLELNLEHTLNKSPFLIVKLGDFNARSIGWY